MNVLPYKKKYEPKVRKSYKKKETVRSLAKKIKALTKSAEVKHGEVSVASAVPDNAPSLMIKPLNSIGQGVGDFNSRVGDQIKVISAGLRCTVRCNSDANPQTLRLICFIYKNNPDNVVNSVSTIVNLFLVSTYMNNPVAVLAPKDYDNRENFHTLYDERRVIHKGNSTNSDSITWDVFVKVPKQYQEVHYVAAGTGVTKNELMWLFIAENDTGLNLDYIHNVYYTDS